MVTLSTVPCAPSGQLPGPLAISPPTSQRSSVRTAGLPSRNNRIESSAEFGARTPNCSESRSMKPTPPTMACGAVHSTPVQRIPRMRSFVALADWMSRSEASSSRSA
jgi:hypothetical protein